MNKPEVDLISLLNYLDLPSLYNEYLSMNKEVDLSFEEFLFYSKKAIEAYKSDKEKSSIDSYMSFGDNFMKVVYEEYETGNRFKSSVAIFLMIKYFNQIFLLQNSFDIGFYNSFN